MKTLREKWLPLFMADGAGSSGGTSSTPSSTSSPGSTSAPPSSAPSATPSTPSATPSAGSGAGDAGAGEAFDFDSIFTSDGDTSGSPKPGEAEAAAGTPPAAPATPPAPAAGAEPAKSGEQAPGAAPATPPAATTPSPKDTTSPTGAEAPSKLDPSDPASIVAALQANEPATIEHVAKTLFQLSPEEIEALESDTVGTIPKLLAKGFVKSQMNVLQQLSRLIPQMVGRQIEAVRRNAKNEQKFFSRWPDIKAEQHGDLVRRLAYTYRQMHPEATLDQMIEEVGPIVMMTAKITPQPAATPGAPKINGITPPPPAPFIPAAGSAPGGAPSTGDDLTAVEAMFAPQNE